MATHHAYTFKLAKTIVVTVEAPNLKSAQSQLQEQMRSSDWGVAFALTNITQELINTQRTKSKQEANG
jgi:hypothetical protein